MKNVNSDKFPRSNIKEDRKIRRQNGSGIHFKASKRRKKI
jgi:hypothetical protein